MKKLKQIEAKILQFTGKNKARLESIRHPHRQSLKYYTHRVGLTRPLTDADYDWLNNHTTGCYSVDYTMAPHNLSFENRSDAVRFKLTFGGELACKAHQKF
jgi:hypothetical protein